MRAIAMTASGNSEAQPALRPRAPQAAERRKLPHLLSKSTCPAPIKDMPTRRHFISAITAALGGTVFAADGRPKTIVLQSAWDTVNIGDIGHTPGTLRILEEHLPQVRVVLWAAKLDDRVTAMLKTRFPKVEILQGNLFKDGGKDRQVQQAVKDCDLFIRNSGMGQDTTFMQFCRQHGKPYGLFGQSYFPSMIEGDGAAERIDLLNNAAFIYTRETKTLSILKSGGIKTPVLEFGPDGCFGIDVRDDERGLATMKKLKGPGGTQVHHPATAHQHGQTPRRG